jgi:hypothetical protein
MSDLIYHIFWPILLLLLGLQWAYIELLSTPFPFILGRNNELIKSSLYHSRRLFSKCSKKRKRKDEKWHRLLYNTRGLRWEDFRVWILHKKSYPPSRTSTHSDETVVVSLTYLFWLAYSWGIDVPKISVHIHMCIDTRCYILILLSFLYIFIY